MMRSAFPFWRVLVLSVATLWARSHLLGQVAPANAGYKGSIQFVLVDFELDRWNRGNPDAAGCISYTANANNARLHFFSMPNQVTQFNAANNTKAIVCRSTMQFDPPVTPQAVQAINAGYRMVQFDSFAFEVDKWNQAANQTIFGIRYTSNVNNANVTFTNLANRFTGIHFRAPNAKAILLVDNIAHLEPAIAVVRIDVRREGGEEEAFDCEAAKEPNRSRTNGSEVTLQLLCE